MSHAEEWFLFSENIKPNLSLDEVALSQGELYTVLTNKSAKGRKYAIVAVIARTKSEEVIKHIQKIPLSKRRKVREITLDIAGSMKLNASQGQNK